MGTRHPLVGIETIALVAIGGFVGSNLRFLVGLFAAGLVGTLLVNVVGSTVLGFVVYEAFRTDLLAESSRTVLSTGLLSSFTTYSTFALETIQAEPLVGLVNLLLSYLLGFSGVLLGRSLARSMGELP